MSSRKLLFERLNKAKAEVEARRSTINSDASSIEDQESSSTSGIVSNVSSNLVNREFQRGAGRARLFRPDLLDKSKKSAQDPVPGCSTTGTSSSSKGESFNDPSIGYDEAITPAEKLGTKGSEIPLAVNYIRIECKPNASIYEYEVRFEPNIHSNMIRRKLLAGAVSQKVPVFTFDGTCLYLPLKFPDDITTFNRNDNEQSIQIQVIFKRQKSMRECIHFYNVLFKQVMLKLEYVQFGQKMFDPTEPKSIPHRQLTIWPGYVLACDELDDGLMLMLDTSHRVLFDTKVSDLLRRIEMSCRQHPSQNFKDMVDKSLLGAVVLTPYNNKTYTICDVDFSQTPLNKFKTRDGESSYVEYYKRNYGIDIHDVNQPLLISYKDRKMVTKNGQCQEDRLKIALIPEISQLTGLSDEMRSDKMVMRDIASFTRLTPNQRVGAARKFIAKVNETPLARAILDNWGLRLCDDVLRLHGRNLPLQRITVGDNKVIENVSGDFGNRMDGILFEVVDLNNWMLMYTKQDSKVKDEFLIQVSRCAGPMGLKWNKPIVYPLPNDRTDTYVNALRTYLKPDIQMIVFICPTSRDDRYAAIKKICCSESPIASQVINARTLANQHKNRNIVQKILMQMNCKLGGSLWTIKIPFPNVMICGTDTYHSANKTSRSVAAFVASLNKSYTKWYSKTTIQSGGEELGHGLTISMEGALKTYKKCNNTLPDRIIIYRDGVGDGQLKLCKEFEFPQIKRACRLIDEHYNPEITLIVVQKRINLRIFFPKDELNQFENPPPGTILDHTITRRGLFDFYLVSQKMRHGTATPSHYVVVENEANLPPDILQQLSYKLTYQYFNWPGSIRVPAPCQKSYEMKQYKNGLKLAKQILSNPKFTEHGETLAMKGLTLNCLGRKEEAYDHVRRGLRNDLGSHVCWHVYGLLQRSDKKYDEAIKCYRNALKCEKDNIQILRDLSLLQIQMRDLEGYRETRHQLFKLRPSQHASWIGFAMSYHLLGDFATANSVLDTFRQSQVNETYDYKHSELLLYQNQILQESGDFEKALKHIEEFESQIVDKLAVKEIMGDLCLKLGDFEKATTIYEGLIKRNPENTLYYAKFMEAKRVEQPDAIVDMYRKFQADYPRAICPKRLPLNVASGDLFRNLVDDFLRRGLRKGVPPLFVSLRSMYNDEAKVKIISDLMQDYLVNLKESNHFSKSDRETNQPTEPASALLWTLYFLAQHYDYLRDTEKALEYINAAIDHTPTLIELFVCKGRIYKHAGDLIEAFKWLDEAQSLDTADRYINSKCAKYMLRANLIKEAEDICAKFTREDVPAMENLNEMQCMWFQTECAQAYQRLEKWGDALKKCHEIDRHFSEIIEDQFDFHTYCMRKMTLRAYVGLLRLEDVLRHHPFYFKAAKCAIEVYIRLYDKPLPSEKQIEELDTENLPPSELKKLRNKQRKAKKKAELESAQAAQAQVKKEQHNKSRQQNQDGDPEAPQLDELIPDKLARPDDPLEKAIEFLKPLQLLAKYCIETHLLAFEIYYRKNKLLLMLQSIKRAQSIDATNAQLHYCIVRFSKVLKSVPGNAELNEHVKTVLERETAKIFCGKTADQLNQSILEKFGKSYEHVLYVAKAMIELDSKSKDKAINLIVSFPVDSITLQQATTAFKTLVSEAFGASEDQLESYKKVCHKRYPHAILFRDIIPVTVTAETVAPAS